MGFLDRASSGFLSCLHSPEQRCSVLNAHLNTSFFVCIKAGDGLPCPLSQPRRFS